MGLNKRLIGAGATAGAGGLTPSEHFGVVLYEGDGTSAHSINGGKFGGAAAFGIEKSSTQATDSRITTTYYAKNVGSISGWLKKNGNTSELEAVFVTKDDTGAANLLGINLYQEADSDLSARVGNGSSTTIVASSGLTLNNNAWHHFVITWNLPNSTNNVKVYVNGSLSSTGSQTTGSWTGNSSRTFQLGHYTNTNTNNGFSGMLDQVRVFEKELSSSEVSTLYAETASTVESLDPLNVDTTDTLQVLGDTSCIATYRFENDEVDLSGNYNGTGTAIQYAAGRYGQAASFNGSTSKMQTNAKIMGNKTSLTLSFWAKNISVSDYSTLIGEGVDGDTAGYNVAINPNSNQIDFFRSAGTSSYVFRDNFYNFGMNGSDWVHAVFTVSPTQLKYYKNGVNVLTASISNSSTVNSAYNTSFMWDEKYEREVEGQLDQVRIFNKTLSAAEVTTLYNENPLVASYRLDGNSNDDMRTYNGTDNDITYEFGLGFTPDLVWVKNRTSSGQSPLMQDSTRGTGSTKVLFSAESSAEGTYGQYGHIVSFDNGGFTVADGSGQHTNTSGKDYVGWCFKANGGTTSSNTDGTITSTVQANQDAGFSIVKWTTNGSSSQTVGHGLGVTPEIIFFKRLDGSQDWFVETNVIDGGYDYENLNTDAAFQDGGAAWSTRATSTTITAFTSSNNFDYIAYCFKSTDSFSKFGSYEGNGTTTGAIVETGFEPAFVMVKGSSNSGSWIIFDNKRNLINPRDKALRADSSAAETTSSTIKVDFLSNGFQLTGTDTDYNGSGRTYIYMAFAADPDTEQPTLASSFSTVAYTGNSGTQSISGLGFSPSFIWLKNRDTAVSHTLFDVIRGAGTVNQLYSDDTKAMGADTTLTNLTSFDSDGFTLGATSGYNVPNNSGDDYVGWSWKADDNEPTIFGGPAKAVYKFEDNANDVTGTYNGTASNVTYASGKFNKAAVFNGSNSSTSGVVLTNLNDTLEGTSFSISLWVKCSSTQSNDNGEATIIGSAGSSGTAGFDIMLKPTTGYLFFNFGNPNNDTVSTTDLRDNTYHHIVFTYSSSQALLYLDGSLLLTENSPGSLSSIPNEITLGKWATGSYYALSGQIDQVRIYNGIIKAEQVDELYAETVSDNDDLTLGAPPKSIVSANANAGFSIVKHTGNGSTDKIPHGLSAAPELIIRKNLTTGGSGSDWWVYSQHASGSGVNYGYLNHSDAFSSTNNAAYAFNQTAPTSTVFSVGNQYSGNLNNEEIINYCFHSVSGYSKLGSYTGNSSTQSITGVGFQPDWLLIKQTNGSNSWRVFDSARGLAAPQTLFPNLSAAEDSESNTVSSFDSDGWTMGSQQGVNDNGDTYIYWAIKIN